MKKIINDPSHVVAEMVSGLVCAYPTYLTQLPDTTAVVRTDKKSMQGKVRSGLLVVVAVGMKLCCPRHA